MGDFLKGQTYKLAFANLKGGVGKTTSSAATAYILGQRGYKVLVVDTDSQCNLTSLFGQNPDNSMLSLNEVMLGEADINECLIRNVEENVDLLASSPYLSLLEMKMVNMFSRESVLKKYLAKLKNHYDFIVFDTPPALNNMTMNVFVCCDGVIVPSEADILSIKAIYSLNETLEAVRQVNDIKLLGILLTRVERLRGDKLVMDNSKQLAGILNTVVFEHCIRAQKNVKESRLYSTNVVKFSNQYRRQGKTDAGTDYENFVDELLKKLGV